MTATLGTDGFTAIAHAEPLLTREQEGELGFQIEAGVLARERLDTAPSLSVDDSFALRLLVSEGERARERFILANVRLARHWAARRWRTGSVGTLTLEDLTSEGLRAIVHAIEMFDHTLGIKFSTYATFWVREHQSKAVAKSLLLTFNTSDMLRVQAYLRFHDEFTATNFVTPTLADVRAGMGLTMHAAMDAMTMVTAGSMASLDGPLAGSETFHLGEVLPSSEPGPEQVALNNADHDLLVGALEHLSGRERAVVVARTGWDGGTPLTAEQAAVSFGVPVAQVRSVTAAAMTKLRTVLTSGQHSAATSGRARPTLGPEPSLVTMSVDLAA